LLQTVKILGVIPARWASTRLPGKPLSDIGGKPMIVRVAEQVLKTRLLDSVVVATDHPPIAEAVKNTCQVLLTRTDHPTGTDRIGEVMEAYNGFDAVINIQGDEPFIHPEQIDRLAALLADKHRPEIVTLIHRLTDPAELANPSIIKVVRNRNGKALYFSRSPIPHFRVSENLSAPLVLHKYWKHIGIYGYRTEVLKQLVRLPPSDLEVCESLEQLRWLEAGFEIYTTETEYSSFSIDTPDDLEKARNFASRFDSDSNQLNN
jgi:3-deoxy-manno-octulosonate cytidylyltransferase (CMP-KDO synthetase)